MKIKKDTFTKTGYFRFCCKIITTSSDIFLQLLMVMYLTVDTVKPVLNGHSIIRTKIGLQNRLSLNAVQAYCKMLQESILQYFRPSLSYHLSLRLLFCLFLSGRLRQVLLYIQKQVNMPMEG